ncbi:hypothetical protein Tco_0213760 [Tanacetum coccineum]
MANQEQIPPQQEQPFVASKQVSFNLKDIILNTKMRKPFTISPDMYKEYLAEFWYSTTTLENSKVSFSIPTGGIFASSFQRLGMGKKFQQNELLERVSFLLGGDYANIFWEDIILKLKKKQREKVVPYTRFISLLIMYKIKEGYGDDEVTLYPTQVFSVNNWALKPNQLEEPPFTDHMLSICAADKPMVLKAPKPSSIAERVPQGTKPEAQPGHKKQSYLKQPSVSSENATKGGSSKAPTGSKTSHSKKRKESSSAIDSNPSQPPVSTIVDPGMHKEDHQATGGLTSLGVTSKARANPQLSSGMSAFNLNEPIYSASFIIHSEFSSGNDASAVSTAEADPGKLCSYEGLDTVLTQPLTGKQASSIARQVDEEEAYKTIKLEDLAKLVSNVQPSFKDLDSPEDDHVIIVEIDAEEDDGIHAKIEDTSVPKSSSPKSALIQELTNQVIILQSQKHKLELEKNKAEVALLKDQPSFPNVEQLNELLVKSLKTEFSNILSAHDFSSSLPTKLKNLPLKFNKLTEEVKELKNQVHNLEIELPRDLKKIPTKLEDFTKTVTSLLLHVTKALNKFAQVLDSTSSKAGDQSVPSADQANTMPAEGEKNINHARISQLFQRRVEKVNLNKPQPKTTTSPPIPPVITTTTSQMQSPSFQSPPKSPSQPEGEHVKEDKGKKALSSEEAEKESTQKWL